jgi:hypothetical protein
VAVWIILQAVVVSFVESGTSVKQIRAIRFICPFRLGVTTAVPGSILGNCFHAIIAGLSHFHESVLTHPPTVLCMTRLLPLASSKGSLTASP